MEGRVVLSEKVERFTEVPLLVFALLMVPLLLGPYLWELTSEEEEVYFWLDGIIWAIFAVDLLAKFAPPVLLFEVSLT